MKLLAQFESVDGEKRAVIITTPSFINYLNKLLTIKGPKIKDRNVKIKRRKNNQSLSHLLAGHLANFFSIHTSHIVPVVQSDVSRIRTGFEKLVAQRCHEPCFAFSAEDDGTIESIDDRAKVMVVRYRNGKRRCLQFGDIYTNNTGSYIDQPVKINNFNVGDKFKKSDILIYNESFFKPDPYSKQVDWKIGNLAKVALLDNGGTIEDAGIITQPLADKLVHNPTYMREIVLTTDTNIRAIADIGQHLKNTDPLIVFDQSSVDFDEEEDPELVAMLTDLNKQAPKAQHSGEVVKVDVYYKAPLTAMSPSMSKVIKHLTQLKNDRANRAVGCVNEEDFQASKPMTATTKVGMVDLNTDTVIFRFFIRHQSGMRPGDKIFFDSSLKSVVSRVYPDYIYAEDGTKIEACTSARGVLARLITSPFSTGLATGVLDTLEKKILEKWKEAQ